MSSSISNNALIGETDTAIVDFQTDFLNRQKINSTSLCDRYNIHMFTQEFELKQDQVKKTEWKVRAEAFSKVLSNNDHTSYDQTFSMVMNSDMDAIVKKEYSDGVQSNTQVGLLTYTLFGAVLAGTAFVVIERIRRKKRENHSNNNQSRDNSKI